MEPRIIPERIKNPRLLWIDASNSKPHGQLLYIWGKSWWWICAWDALALDGRGRALYLLVYISLSPHKTITGMPIEVFLCGSKVCFRPFRRYYSVWWSLKRARQYWFAFINHNNNNINDNHITFSHYNLSFCVTRITFAILSDAHTHACFGGNLIIMFCVKHYFIIRALTCTHDWCLRRATTIELPFRLRRRHQQARSALSVNVCQPKGAATSGTELRVVRLRLLLFALLLLLMCFLGPSHLGRYTCYFLRSDMFSSVAPLSYLLVSDDNLIHF